jgi:hypothetical protein
MIGLGMNEPGIEKTIFSDVFKLFQLPGQLIRAGFFEPDS